MDDFNTYYHELHTLLIKKFDSRSETVNEFSSFFVNLELQIHDKQAKEKKLKQIIIDAKRILYNFYCKLLCSLPEKTDLDFYEFFVQPQESILPKEMGIQQDAQEEIVTKVTTNEAPTVSVPVISVVQQKPATELKVDINSETDKPELMLQQKTFVPKSIPRLLYDIASLYFPIIKWVPEYRHHWRDLKDDVFVGLTVGVMLIPQSLSYVV